jgi:hypothetical protein
MSRGRDLFLFVGYLTLQIVLLLLLIGRELIGKGVEGSGPRPLNSDICLPRPSRRTKTSVRMSSLRDDI